MPTRIDTKQLNASVDPAVAIKFKALADAHGMSVHAYHIRLLTQHAKQTQVPAQRVFVALATADKLPETVQVWLPVKLALRLHSAAAQLRDDSGKPLQPTALVRELLIYECQHTTDIVHRIMTQCRPDYIDMTPLTGKAKYSRVEWCEMFFYTVYMAFDTKQAVLGEAQSRGCPVTLLLRQTLNTHLPHLGD